MNLGHDRRILLLALLAGLPALAAATILLWLVPASGLLRGTVLGEAKSRFYADIDLFLFPSLYAHETQSIVVPEAMAAGMPVLVAAFGIVLAVIKNKRARAK